MMPAYNWDWIVSLFYDMQTRRKYRRNVIIDYFDRSALELRNTSCAFCYWSRQRCCSEYRSVLNDLVLDSFLTCRKSKSAAHHR